MTVPAVTLTQSGFRVVAGRYIRLSGTVAGAQPGVSVTVLAQPFGTGAYAQVGTVLTGGGGTWTFLAQPRVGDDVRRERQRQHELGRSRSASSPR